MRRKTYITCLSVIVAAVVALGFAPPEHAIRSVANLFGNRIKNVGTPTDASDAATKSYVDAKTWGVASGGTGLTSATSSSLLVSGETSTGAFGTLAQGTTGQFLQSQGIGSYPIWTTVTTPNVQEFTSSGTWTKPSGLTWYCSELTGPGGSGGGGARIAGNAGGGGGGAGGGRVIVIGPLSELASTQSVVVGQPGAIGVGATTLGTSGTAATSGTNTTFYLYRAIAGAPGAGGSSGGGGAGGTTSASSGMYFNFSTANTAGGAGGGGGVSGSSPTAQTSLLPTGGGGGGGINAAGTVGDGGNGGALNAGAFASSQAGGLGGIKGTRTPATGGAVAGCGLGGGGGGSSNTGSPGQTAAAGGFPGGGGGGGGGGYNTVGGGNGALGGGGFVRITCWLKRDLPTRRSTLDSFSLAF